VQTTRKALASTPVFSEKVYHHSSRAPPSVPFYSATQASGKNTRRDKIPLIPKVMNTNPHFLKFSRKQKRAGAHQKSRKFSALSGSILKLAASALLLGAASLPAAVVYWDADGTAIGNNASSGAGLGGAGTWNASNSKWWDGSSLVDAAFPGTGTDTAIFTGTGGIVQLGSAITVQTLTFNSDGFTITGGTGGTNALTLASNNAVNVNVAGTATVSAVVAGSGGLTVNSTTTGTLALTGVNTYTGLTTVNAGTLLVTSSGNLNSGNNLTVGALGKATFDNGSQDLGTVLNSGRLDFTDTGGTITLGPVSNGGSGIMNFAGGTNTLGAVTNGGTMNFTGVGATNTLASLTGAGAANFSGYTIITGQFDTGTATFGGTAEIGTAASGTLYMNGFQNKITTLNGGTTVIFGSAANSYDLPIPVDLTVHDGSAAGSISGDGSLTVTGPLTLSGNNTYTLGTTVDGGVLLVNNTTGSGTGSGLVTVNSGVGHKGTLGGTGSIGGGVTLAAGAASYAQGASLNPGTAGTVGTLTINGPITTNGFTTLGFDLNTAQTVGSNVNDVIFTTTLPVIGSTTAVAINTLGSLTPGTYTLISGYSGTIANLAGLSLLPFTGADTTHSGTLLNNSGNLQLFVAGATPAGAYWAGSVDGDWNTQGLTTAATNWRTDATGNTDTYALPGPASTVYFYTTTPSAGNLTTNNLAAPFSIAGLNFTSAATSDVTIGNSGSNVNTLTVGTGGITMGNNTGNDTINANVVLNGSQAWTNNSTGINKLIVNGSATSPSITGSGNLTVAGAGSTIINASIQTGGTLTKNGGGTLILTGTNNVTNPYTTTAINGGTLQVGNGGTTGTLGSGAVILNNNATLAFNRSDNYGGAVSNNINGAGGVTVNAGTLALTGSNGYTGPTTLNGGILVMTSASQIGSVGSINFSSGQLQASGTFALGNAIHVTSATAGVIVDANQTLTLNGNLTGGNPLAKQGPGLLVLNGTSDAATVLNAGSVSVTSTSAGTSLTVNSGADVTFNQPVGGGTYSNPISGAGDVTVMGSLALAGGNNGFTGTLTIASTTSASTVTVASPTNLGGSEVQLTSTTTTTPAKLQITGGGTYSNPITVGDGITTGVTGLVIYSGNVAVTFSGTLTKTGTTFELVGSNSLGGTVTITGQITGNTGGLNSDMSYNGGTFNLNGASPNTYFGPTYLTNAVTVNANSVGALPTLNGRSPVFMDQTGSGSSNLVLGANQSIAALTGATSSSVNLNGNTLTIGTDSGSTTFAGAISGAGGLIKDGASTQVLSGSNASYTGTTTVRAGALVLDYSTNNGTKLSSTAVLTLGSATLQLTGGTQTEVVGSTTITGGANVIGNNTSSATNGGGSANTASNTSAVLQMASITRNPGGTVNFSGQYIATTNTLNSPTTGLLGPWATIGGTDFAINQNNTANGWIVKYTGYTLVPRLNGTSQVINDGSATNVQIVEGASGILNPITLGSAVTTINTLNQSASGGTSAATIDLAGQTLAVNGILAGAGGAGSLTIGTGSGANLGTLKAATPGGELVLNNYSAAAPGLIINSVIANNTSASSLTQSGTGTTQLTAANTYTGMTTVSAGTLNLQSSGNAIASTGNTADVVVSGTGTLALLGGDQIVNTANVAVSGGTLSMGNSSDTVHGVQLTGGSIIGTGGVLTSTTAFDMQNGSVSAGLGGSAGLTKSSGGTVSLSGANTYTGTTNVTAGILTTSGTMATTAVSVSSGASFTGTNTGANSAMATNAAVTNNGAMSLAASQTISTLNGTTAGATLAVARGSTLNVTGGGTYAGAINDISGTGAGANLTAGGSLTLQGNNAYTGATVVSAGATLAVTGSGAVGGTSSVTVNSGATFELNAAATNAVNSGANYVSNGGTLSIGPNLQTFALMKLGTGVSSTLNFNNVAGTLSFGSLDSSTKTALSSSPITLNIDNWTGSAYTIGTSSVTLDPLQSSLIFSNDPGFTLGQVIPGVYFAGYGAGMAVTVQVAGGGTAYQIVPATVVPEPATAALLGSVALCALIGCRKRRRSPGF
jgi:autotransporter-associated beta strand protein